MEDMELLHESNLTARNPHLEPIRYTIHLI